MKLKHRWTFEEDLIFCNKYLDFFVEQKSNVSLSDFSRLVLASVSTEISFNSAKMKVQNIKAILIELNISDSLKTAPAKNYSKQNLEARKYALKQRGLKFDVLAEQPEKDNPLRTAEMTVEDDYGMIDGVINNGRKGEEQEAAKAEAARTSPEKRPSIRERLAEAKKECGERKSPDKAHQKKPPEHDL